VRHVRNEDKLKSAVFDIETSALEGIGAGMLICACVRPLSTGRTRSYKLEGQYEYSKDFGFFERQEKDLLIALLDELRKYDLLIGHNIERFDLPFLRTRAYRHGIQFDMMPIVYDTMQAFGRVRLRTIVNAQTGRPMKSLDMIADLLGVTQEKTKIYPAEHWQNIWGNEKQRAEAMGTLLDHCVKDVRMNAQIYDILLPLDSNLNIKRWK